MTTTPSDISEDFTAVGTSDRAIAWRGAFSIGGTFVGTVELQRIVNGATQVLATYTTGTVEGDDVSFDNGAALPMQFEVTAFTSGTIQARLIGQSQDKG